MSKPHISVIMPAYNAQDYICAALRSVQAQTYQDWELIVVDDGSEDRTAERVQALSREEPRLHYLFQPNGGQAAARNTGLGHARGEWIAFLDADDLWMPEKLEQQLATAEEKGADLVFTSGYTFFDDDSADKAHPFTSPAGRFAGRPLVTALFQQNFIASLSVLANKSALEAVGGFDEDRRLQNAEDYDLWLRLAQQERVFYGMSARLFRYRRHPQSVTFREVNQFRPEIAVLMKHADTSEAPPRIRRQRFRSAYRALAAALLREGKISEARAALEELSARWDPCGLATGFQRVILRLFPRQFNRIMAPLYRIGGRLKQWKAATHARRPDRPVPRAGAPAAPP